MITFYQYDIDESSVFGQRRVTITPTYTAMTEDLAGKPGRLHSCLFLMIYAKTKTHKQGFINSINIFLNLLNFTFWKFFFQSIKLLLI